LIAVAVVVALTFGTAGCGESDKTVVPKSNPDAPKMQPQKSPSVGGGGTPDKKQAGAGVQ
jgi:hypothetical protein